MVLGVYSYGAAAAGFGLFAIMLVANMRYSMPGKLLALAVVITALWAGLATAVAVDPEKAEHWVYQTFEVLRYVAWYAFLLKLLSEAVAASGGRQRGYLYRVASLCLAFALLLIAFESYTGFVAPHFEESARLTLIIIGHLFLPIIGLSFVEQLFRNTAVQHRWSIKYLFLAIGGMFAFDFFLYADALEEGMVNDAIPDVPANVEGIYAVYPPGRFTQPKVRAFIDFLVHSFQGKGPDIW